jgi:peptidoglycan/LPS O-acetylase OafA/YrhL
MYFFVLSGYLITGLLVREIEHSGTLDLPRFYARRARRLLPAMTLMLIVVILASVVIFSPGEQRNFTTTAASTAAYASNIYFIVSGAQYGAGRADDNPLLHTWSLSVEEQFYLVWPVFVMFALGGFRWQTHDPYRRRRLLMLMLTVTALSFALSYYLTGIRQPWAYFSSPTRAWNLHWALSLY